MISHKISHKILPAYLTKPTNSIFLKKIILFYLFLAALGLPCCAQASSSCGEQGLLFIVVASFVAEHGL